MLFMQIKYHDPSLLLTKCILLVGDAQPKAVFDYFYTADGGADEEQMAGGYEKGTIGIQCYLLFCVMYGVHVSKLSAANTLKT